MAWVANEVMPRGPKKQSLTTTYGHLLESAKSTLVTSKCIAFSHIRRSGNRVAHSLAKYARHVRGLSVWVEDMPPHLYDVLFADPGWFFNKLVVFILKKKKKKRIKKKKEKKGGHF